MALSTTAGDLMVAIWWGTQADEAFPDAWHSDAGGQAQFRSKVYLSPKLWYLRVNVIEAQDLLASDRVMAVPVCITSCFCFHKFSCYVYW